jgi:hypothetical protein
LTAELEFDVVGGNASVALRAFQYPVVGAHPPEVSFVSCVEYVGSVADVLQVGGGDVGAGETACWGGGRRRGRSLRQSRGLIRRDQLWMLHGGAAIKKTAEIQHETHRSVGFGDLFLRGEMESGKRSGRNGQTVGDHGLDP